MSVPGNIQEEVLRQLHSAGLTSAAIIGSVLPKGDRYLVVVN